MSFLCETIFLTNTNNFLEDWQHSTSHLFQEMCLIFSNTSFVLQLLQSLGISIIEKLKQLISFCVLEINNGRIDLLETK